MKTAFAFAFLSCALEGRSAPPAYEYHLLNPNFQDGSLSVMSLADGNKVRAGTTTLSLNRYQTGSIPAGPDLSPGMVISATGPFSLGGQVDATDLPVPGRFIGKRFVIPHFRDDHTYHILSPYADAQVTITLNGLPTVITAFKGQVLNFDAGSTNGISGLISSDQPILVSHSARGGTRDVYPVPPVARELWGVRSNSAAVGAWEDNTTVTVYGSDGSTETFVLDAGGYRTLTVPGGSQGTGSGVHIVADKPIAAIQAADSDGVEATAFLDTSYLATRYGIPVDAQYVAVVCPSDTSVTLINGTTTDSQVCAGDGTRPGKAYFGSTENGAHIAAGAYIEADAPVYLYYEASKNEDERNLTGHKDNYFVLNPRIQNGSLSVMSLADDNWIRAGSANIWLNRYDLGTIPSSDLAPGTEIWGTGPFTLGGKVDATDLPVPGVFAGNRFIIPHYRDTHTYYLLSPYGDATAEIQIGTTTETVTLPQGQVVSYAAGSDTAVAGLIRADRPILVSHLAGTAGDVYPVPPASTELWGIRSTNATMAALEDNTTVTVYTSDGQSATYVLNAGVRKNISLGANTNQGQGVAVHLVADKPIAAYQVADSDGYEATAYLQEAYHGTRFGIPVDAQYIAVVCTAADTVITLYDPPNLPTVRICSGSDTYPGKAYFGSVTNGTNIGAGAYLESNQPIYVIYEASATNDEHNLLGYNILPPPGPAAPSLAVLPATTTDNPLTVTGVATPNSEVRLYVNGVRQATATASATDGTFTFNAILVDGNNDIYATVWDGTKENQPSASQAVNYQNSIDRNQVDTVISRDTVWTPGSTPTPYVITGTLSVDPGVTFWIQPGTVLKFESGAKLEVNGRLVVQGSLGNEVVFTSGREVPKKGDWQGIRVNAGAVAEIDHAVVEWAYSGIDFYDASGWVRNSLVQDNQQSGIYVRGSSPRISGNVVRYNRYGVYVAWNSAPVIDGGNEITANTYGVYVDGVNQAGTNPAPVVNGNSIYGNSSKNYYAYNFYDNKNVVLDARGNWWGSVVPGDIAPTIHDFTDRMSSSPVVDYGDFLDGPGGNVVTGNWLNGPVADGTVLSGGVVYEALGHVYVPPGVTLTVEAGAVLRFSGKWQLKVDGTLRVLGVAGGEVVFTSGREVPKKGDWQGIRVNAGAVAEIDHAVVEYSNNGVYVDGGNVTVTSSLLHFNTNGLYLTGAGGTATITASQLVYNGSYGIYAVGTGSDGTNPTFKINGSDIFGNGSWQAYLVNYGTASVLTLNATGNWWGTPTPVFGTEIRQGYSMPAVSIVDFGAAAAGPLLQPALASISVDNAYISPANGDGVQDVVVLSGTLSEPADWVVEVRDASGNVLRTFTGTGDVVSASWDGLDGVAGQAADGRYDFMVRTTAGTRSGHAGGIPVTVDNTPPVADLDDALNGAVLQNVLTAEFVGTADDENFLNYQVEQGVGAAPAAWTSLGGVQSTAVDGGVLASWVLSTEEGTAPVANGDYTLRLTVTDKAGNVSVDTATITVDNMTVTSVAAVTSVTGRTDKLDLAQGETIDIQFDLNLPGTVTLRIYPEQQGVEGTPVRTIVQSFATPGTHTISWDGKDDAGVPVEDELYIYVLEASDGTRIGRYLPTAAPATTRVDVGGGGSYPNFNGYTNDYWRADVTLSEPGRVQLVLTLQSLGNKVIYPNGAGELLDAGTHTLVWDGRDPETGDIYVGTFQVKINHVAFPGNGVWVVGNNVNPPPVVTGTLSLEVKTDPYLVYLSYGQFTKFSYRLDVPGGAPAYVEIKLLPPGVYDPSDPRAVVVKRQLQVPGDYTVQWDGISAADPNGTTREMSEDGVYTFAITATTSNGASTLVRSVINAYQ